jgi:hypothetical protein
MSAPNLSEWISKLDPGVPSPAEFRARLTIDADGRPVTFKPDFWQDAAFLALDPAWRALAGLGPPATVTRSWQERPRGHSKTCDLAIMIAWALAYSRRPLRGVAAAADRDQSKFLRDALGVLVRLNPQLQCLDVQQWSVHNRATGSSLEIISSDVSSSWGHLPDFVICDEVAVWPEGRGEGLFGSLFSASVAYPGIGEGGPVVAFRVPRRPPGELDQPGEAGGTAPDSARRGLRSALV